MCTRLSTLLILKLSFVIYRVKQNLQEKSVTSFNFKAVYLNILIIQLTRFKNYKHFTWNNPECICMKVKNVIIDFDQCDH